MLIIVGVVGRGGGGGGGFVVTVQAEEAHARVLEMQKPWGVYGALQRNVVVWWCGVLSCLCQG